MITTVQGYLALILIFFRISGIFLPFPIFGTNNIPSQVKVAFIILLGLIMLPVTVDQFNPDKIDSFMTLTYYCLSEFAIGLSYGLISVVVLNAVYIAGGIIDMVIGLSIVSVISPQDEQEIPVSANILYLLAMMIFLATDMHHVLIRAIRETFQILPVGTGIFDFSNTALFNDFIIRSFAIGFQIAAPFVLTVLVVDIVLGLLSRAMPAMNIFVLGMPAKILVGLLLYLSLMPYYDTAIKNIFVLMFEMMKRYITSLG